MEDRIQKDMIQAMKEKDSDRLRTLRAIKSEILLEKTTGKDVKIDEAREISILQKMVKSRQESLEIYEKENREDLAKKEKIEIEHLQKYLPEPMTEEEIKSQVEEIIERVGASSMADMGKVMGMAQKEMGGKADGKTLAGIVKSILSQ